MKRKIYLLVMMFVSLMIVGCSDDEKGLRFTEDEVVGDILTGKQVGIKDNTLNVYTTEENTVNVQGASGKIVAVSADDKIATVYCDNSDEKRVHVKGVAVGKTKITVTDTDGNSATFIADVKDVETAWKTSTIYYLNNKYCVVEGVNKDDSIKIASEVIDIDKKAAIVLKKRGVGFGDDLVRILYMDKQGNVLLDGMMNKSQNESHIINIWVTPRESYSSVLLDSFCLDTSKGQPFMVWDLTNAYKEEYPMVTSVKLYVRFTSPL